MSQEKAEALALGRLSQWRVYGYMQKRNQMFQVQHKADLLRGRRYRLFSIGRVATAGDQLVLLLEVNEYEYVK